MPAPLVRRTTAVALLATALAVVTGCGDGGSAGPPRSTVAQTSTTYATIPARSTTTTVAASPGDASSSGADAGGPESSVADDPNQERIHEIRRGDFLVRIAREYEVAVDNIPAYNGWDDGLEHALVPGQTIRIPPADWTPDSGGSGDANADPAGSEPEPADACPGYTITRGDTPAKVAAAHDVSVAELDAANAGTPHYRAFVVGIEIVIPC